MCPGNLYSVIVIAALVAYLIRFLLCQRAVVQKNSFLVAGQIEGASIRTSWFCCRVDGTFKGRKISWIQHSIDDGSAFHEAFVEDAARKNKRTWFEPAYRPTAHTRLEGTRIQFAFPPAGLFDGGLHSLTRTEVTSVLRELTEAAELVQPDWLQAAAG